MLDSETYGAARAYTEKSLLGLGALKGKNCTIKSIDYENGVNIVTFEWTADNGVKDTGQLRIKDGSFAEEWKSKGNYKEKQVVVKDGGLLQCLEDNNDEDFDPNKWNPLGGGESDARPLTDEQLNNLLSLI